MALLSSSLVQVLKLAPMGLHPAAFTYEEWQQIRSITQSMARAPQRQTKAKRFYEFAGYLADIHCGLPLRCQGKSTTTDYEYYRDTARQRRIPCPAGGHLVIRSDLVRQQFGDTLKSLSLPDNWREEIRRQMLAEAQSAGVTGESVEREKERLKLKRVRVLKQHREGYIDDDEFQGEMAAVDLALRQLETPEVNGVKFDDVIAAGEHIPGMAALWDVATPEERREMVMLLLEPGGLYYDLELKMLAALKPRPAFLPILRMLKGVVEYDEVKGILVTENWQDRNRRASDDRQDTFLTIRPSKPAGPPSPRFLVESSPMRVVARTTRSRREAAREGSRRGLLCAAASLTPLNPTRVCSLSSRSGRATLQVIYQLDFPIRVGKFSSLNRASTLFLPEMVTCYSTCRTPIWTGKAKMCSMPSHAREYLRHIEHTIISSNTLEKLKGRKVMRPFLPVRKAFLLAALVYVLNAAFSLAVALLLNLTDPEIPGTARETWFSNGTALTAPGFFLILFVLFLGLATRPRWPGTSGIVGVTVLAVISGMATLADWGMVQRILAYHLNIATVLSLALLCISIPATALLGIMTLVLQWRSRTKVAISS